MYDQTSAFTIIVLKPRDEGGLKAQELIDKAQDGLPEIIIGKPSFKWDDENSMGGQRFSVQLTGESTEKLAELGDEVARVMSSVKGLEAVRSEAREGDEEVQIVVNRQRAAALGLTSSDVAQAVAAGMRGDRLREFRGTERELTLRLAFRESDRQTVDNLAEFPIYLPTRHARAAVRGRGFPHRQGAALHRTRRPPDLGRDHRQREEGCDARRRGQGSRSAA